MFSNFRKLCSVAQLPQCLCLSLLRVLLGCTDMLQNTSCRFLSSEIPQPCQAVTAPLSRQQQGAEWMCTSIIYFLLLHPFSQLGAAGLCQQSMEDYTIMSVLSHCRGFPPPKTHSSYLCTFNSTILYFGWGSHSLTKETSNSPFFFYFYSIYLLIQFTKPV